MGCLYASSFPARSQFRRVEAETPKYEAAALTVRKPRSKPLDDFAPTQNPIKPYQTLHAIYRQQFQPFFFGEGAGVSSGSSTGASGGSGAGLAASFSRTLPSISSASLGFALSR